MKTSEGNVVLCPGCAETGTFIGPLAEPEIVNGEGYGNLSPLSEDRQNYFVLRDEDGGTSGAVDVGNIIEQLPELPTNQDIEAGIEAENRIYERVGKCAAGTVCATNQCPAINGGVIRQVLWEEYQKVATRLKQEGK